MITKSEKEQAEGSREIIDRELERAESDQPQADQQQRPTSPPTKTIQKEKERPNHG